MDIEFKIAYLDPDLSATLAKLDLGLLGAATQDLGPETQGLGHRDPATQGPADPGPRDPFPGTRTWGPGTRALPPQTPKIVGLQAPCYIQVSKTLGNICIYVCFQGT